MSKPILIPPTFYNKISPGKVDINELKKLIKIRYDILQKVYAKMRGSFLSKIIIPNEISWEKEPTLLKDIASHFILALAFSKNETDREWFANAETFLFQERMTTEGKGVSYNIPETLKILGIPLKYYENCDEGLYRKITFSSREKAIDEKKKKIYSVPFEHALQLVATQKYFINKGNVYIAESDIGGLFQAIFKANLMKNFKYLCLHYKNITEDIRIKSILINFERQKEYEAYQKSEEIEDINPENRVLSAKEVDKVAKQAFPLCMYMIERHIDRTSHLMHLGRLMYTLFLKGIGLPMEEALEFFKKKYEKKTPADKFEKNYAYNIRHSYGQEGKRTTYSPYSCSKILAMAPPSGQECHGCPFKTYREDNLKQILFEMNIPEVSVEEILSEKRKNDFPMCCARLFESRYGKENLEKIGTHPNHYFRHAMEALNKRKKEKIEYEREKKNETVK